MKGKTAYITLKVPGPCTNGMPWLVSATPGETGESEWRKRETSQACRLNPFPPIS
jgi:hypothetical protein